MSESAEILCIGTEILLGNIVNTNSQVLSRGLAELGVNVYRYTAVGDNPERLREALDEAFARNDIVITTGGLGPTYDDLSKETIADWFGLPLEMHEPSARAIEAYFGGMKRPMCQSNLKQAMMPRGCTVLENRNGTAPGAIIEGKGKTAIMLPGPPREMTPMFERQVLPYLAKRADHVLRSHCIYFFGIGESTLESQLRGEMQAMKNPTLAPYAKDGEVMLRVTASAPTEAEAERLMEPVIASLRERYPQYIYGVDVDNLQTAAVRALKDAGLTAAAAESCTGGYIAKRLTDVPGSSEVFGCGAVTYANGAKERLLGVQGSTLARYGAVSPQTAREMADGVRRLSGADIGVSTTGVAGPDGGTDEKPVGLVYVGISSEWLNDVVELRLGRGFDYGEREFIRYLASSHALAQILRAAQSRPE